MDDEYESAELLREMIEKAIQNLDTADWAEMSEALDTLKTEYEAYDRECHALRQNE